MSANHKRAQADEITLIEDTCTWYIDRYFLIGRERVIWMGEESAQLYVAGSPSIKVTGHSLRRLRAALAMSGLAHMAATEREAFDKQYRYALAERERPLVDEAAEALLAEQRRAPLEQALHESLAQLPTDADLNRAMIKETLEHWRSGRDIGKRAARVRTGRPEIVAGPEIKVRVAVDSARAAALAASRQCGQRAR